MTVPESGETEPPDLLERLRKSLTTDLDRQPCVCGHPRYQHLNHGDWCGGWHDRYGEPCPCTGYRAAPAVAEATR